MADQVGVRTQRTGTLGCIGCNAFVGPGFADTDLGLQEDFPIAEKLTAQLRIEMFNASNRVNLQAPNNYVDSPTFKQSVRRANREPSSWPPDSSGSKLPRGRGRGSLDVPLPLNFISGSCIQEEVC
jgi:hypothetical protein